MGMSSRAPPDVAASLSPARSRVRPTSGTDEATPLSKPQKRRKRMQTLSAAIATESDKQTKSNESDHQLVRIESMLKELIDWKEQCTSSQHLGQASNSGACPAWSGLIPGGIDSNQSYEEVRCDILLSSLRPDAPESTPVFGKAAEDGGVAGEATTIHTASEVNVSILE